MDGANLLEQFLQVGAREGYDKLRCLRAQFANFVGVIRGSDRPRITGADALASVEAIESETPCITIGYRSATCRSTCRGRPCESMKFSEMISNQSTAGVCSRIWLKCGVRRPMP